MLTVEDKLEAEGRIDVGEAFQGILADLGDTFVVEYYHTLDDGDALAVESMFVAGDTLTVGDVAAVGLGVGTKV